MKFFGRKKDQDLHQFIAETKELTELDKTELTPLLEKELGETIDPSEAQKV